MVTPYKAPLDDLGFVLDHVVRVADLPLASEAAETAPLILAEAGRFAEHVLSPLNAIGDGYGAMLQNGGVQTAPGFKEALARFGAAGWMGLVFPETYGGQGLPWTLNAALSELWSAANLAFQICPLLTQGAVEALMQHGSEAQRATWVPPMVAGTWTGAMCLTEPQAGSDLGAIRTTATPADDPEIGPHHRLYGQKIFISWGDHDMAPNIVHLVLARLPDAPPGPKGISLFIVPKFLPRPDGGLGPRNDWRCLKLETKLGIHASPTCVIAYGDGDGAVGFLVGPPHQGLACMFTMMNNARLAVGVEGLGLAERAFQAASAYAGERVQGRRGGRPVRLTEHPDIQRLLTGMAAEISAMRALCLTAFAAVDTADRHEDAAVREAAAGRAALLTPVVKAWCTDRAVAIASDTLQVYGGMGYVEESGVAQLYRDARILPIYEGTNGIQAIDLACRKLSIEDGQLPWQLFAEMRGWPGDPALAAPLEQALQALEGATRHLQALAAADREAAAVPYLDLFGRVLSGWLLAKGGAIATATGDARGQRWPALARFYVERMLPPALGLAAVVKAAPFDASALMAGSSGGN